MISKAVGGSVADLVVLKRHADEVNQMIGATTVLADQGYRGDTRVANLRVVSQANEAERSARVIVERFFGRLKNTFIVFARTWELSWVSFDDFFDVACALTNVTIITAPLNFDDWLFNQCLLEKWAKEIRHRAITNHERYLRKKNKRSLKQHMATSFLNLPDL